jgi:putative tricarboxylic transport membrane protein
MTSREDKARKKETAQQALLVTSDLPVIDETLMTTNPLLEDISLDEEAPLTMNKRVDLIGSLALFAVGVVVLVIAFTYPTPTIVFDAIGPMGFPYVIGSFLVVGGLFQSARTFLYIRRFGMWAPEEGSEDEPEHPSSRWRAVGVMAGSFVFLALLDPVGYLIMMPLAIIAALWSLKYRNWLWRAIVAVVFTIASFILFAMVLKVPMPNGIFTDILIDLNIVQF